ncbi:MAG TPA: hypothetical protein VHQ93_14700 [Chitinophagaceae bacterium]|jgi:hypothetical protein|nr:hypothetical protein [Chitinophagaceae bacterium]
MKQFFLFFLTCLCVNVFATVRTVNNNPNSLAQYNTIQAAVDAAVNGDTIYIHGSNISYGSVTVSNKRLIFIGPGWSPLRNIDPLTALISQMTFQSAGCDNSEIQGLVFTAIVTLGFNHPNNIRFYRNQFINTQVAFSYGTTDYSGFVFQDNWFDKSQIIGNQNNTYTNCIFQNNIFYHNIATTANIYGLTNSNGVLFDHNLFYGPSSGAGVVFAGDCRSLLITNNIFVRRNAAANCTSSTFNNNITYNAGVDTPWIATHGNIGTNNIANQNPQMVDQAAVNIGTDDPLSNFTIAAGPANNSGSDGKDMGLLYDLGMLNWSNSRMSRVPFIYNMVISNSTIAPGGTLNVQVEARKSN